MRYLSNYILLILLFGVGLNASLFAQLVVDGSGLTPGAHRSISDAAALATSGTVIEIVGIVDSSGNPVGYSETPYLTGQLAEAFPISVQSGVTLRRMGSAPVYIWSTGGAPTLFDVQSSTMKLGTKFTNLNLGGGGIAISATPSGVGNRADLSISGCLFTGNRIAAQVSSSSGAIVQMEVVNCILTDATLTTPASPPAYQAPAIGFQFGASGNGAATPSSTRGSIEELTVTGTFASMSPEQSWYSLDNRIATTRVVDVWAEGDDPSTAQFRDAPGSYTPYDIPEVELDILGGAWVGGDADSSGGWGEAIHAEAKGGDNQAYANFYSGYRINVTGTQISDFREDGIFCGSSLNSRGHLNMNGQASVTGTGFVGSFSETRNSGVYLYSVESYMGFTAAACGFSSNQGNGVLLKTDGELFADVGALRLLVPSGIFLGLHKTRIHDNGASGVLLLNQPSQPSGFIGGTIHQMDDQSGFFPFTIGDLGRNFTYVDGSPLYNGQGVINRSDISNNGYAGVKVLVDGTSGIVPGELDTAPSGVALRLSNDFIWSNPHGGLNVNWVALTGHHEDAKGYILVPTTHTTMVYNGDASHDYTMEIDDKNGAAPFQRAIYQWQDPGIAPAPFYRTNVWNSTLQRTPGSVGSNDLGPVLDNPFNSIVDDSSAVPDPDQVGFAGVRATGPWFFLTSGSDRNTNEPSVPFIGPLSPASTSSTQFKLTNSGPGKIIDWTPGYFHVLAPLTFIDHGGQSRPGETSGTRDKGADEVD